MTLKVVYLCRSMMIAKDIHFFRQGERVLEGVSLEILTGQIVGLTGPNGAGKTTLLEILAGHLTPSSGQVVCAEPLAYLSQQITLKKFPPIVVRDFVEMGTWGASSVKPALTVKEAIEAFDLLKIGNRLVSELSGGQMKQALLARTFCQPANLYVLDEPFNHLDFEAEHRLGHFLRGLVKNQRAVFLVSHDWHAMDHFLDRLILLNKKVISVGSVAEIEKIYFNWRDPDQHRLLHV